MVGARRSVRDVMKRRDMLCDIIEEHEGRGEKLSMIKLYGIAKDRIKNYSQSTFYRDMKEINQDNTFVRDIVESHFSKMVEDNYNALVEIEGKIAEWEKNPPTIIKQYKDYIETGKQITIKHPLDNKKTIQIPERIPYTKEQSVETISPVTIAQFKIDVIKLKLDILKGNIVDTSIALITNKFSRMEEELAQKDMQIEALKQEKENADIRQSDK